LLAQKKEQEKGTRLSRPPLADILRFSLLAGRKKLATLKQFLRQIPPTAPMLSVKEWGLKKHNMSCLLMPIITLPHFLKIDGNSARTV